MCPHIITKKDFLCRTYLIEILKKAKFSVMINQTKMDVIMNIDQNVAFPQLGPADWLELVKKEMAGKDPLQLLSHCSIDEVEYPPLADESSRKVTLKTFPKHSSLIPLSHDMSLGVFNPVDAWNRSDYSLEKIIAEGKEQQKVEIATHLVHDAGATAVDELVLALSLGLQYPDKCIRFKLAVGCELYLNVAKLRALRYLWEQFCEQNQIPYNFEIVTVSSLREFTLYDEWNNELRNTCSAAAALMGGADKIMLYPHDELLTRFNEVERNANSVRLAENVFHILQEESYLTKVNDPTHGSYAIEDLTLQLVELATSKLIQHEKDNYSFYWQDLPARVESTAAQRFAQLRTLKKIVTGINSFTNPEQKFLSNKIGPKFYESPQGKFHLRRLGEEFENLRIGFEKISNELNGVILCDGDRKLLTPRINFCKNIFEISGIVMEEVFLDDEKVSQKIAAAQVVVLCALDDEYGPLLLESEKISKFTSNIYIAGKIKPEDIADYPIRSTVYRGQDTFSLLKQLLEEMMA